jgi:hypothetical protein
MPADNIIHYILYVAILVGFFFVLKSPKKGKDDPDGKDGENTPDDKA